LKVGKAMPLDALNSFWLCPLSANSSIRRAISSLLSINFVFMQSYRTENHRKTCTWWGGYFTSIILPFRSNTNIEVNPALWNIFLKRDEVSTGDNKGK